MVLEDKLKFHVGQRIRHFATNQEGEVIGFNYSTITVKDKINETLQYFIKLKYSTNIFCVRDGSIEAYTPEQRELF